MRSTDPYRNQTKAKGTGGSPTPSFLPKMFTNSIDRFKNLIGDSDVDWANKLLSITENHEDSMNRFRKIALKVEEEDSSKNRSLS